MFSVKLPLNNERLAGHEGTVCVEFYGIFGLRMLKIFWLIILKPGHFNSG